VPKSETNHKILITIMPNLESTYNIAETDCIRLLEILQDKVLNLKKSGKTWGNVAELNRLKIELNEANQNF